MYGARLYPPDILPGSFHFLRFGNFLQSRIQQFSEMGVNVIQNKEATPDGEKDREEEEKEEPEGENELVEPFKTRC
ncbi:MAG TPA: hypothetical protein VI756_18125 [Blastocatellia bacterium]